MRAIGKSQLYDTEDRPTSKVSLVIVDTIWTSS